MKEPYEMIKFFAVNMKIGKRLKERAMIDLDNDAIYTQRDLDEQREAIIAEVLKIVESKKYSQRWNIQEELWNLKMDEIKADVLRLKGGEQE